MRKDKEKKRTSRKDIGVGNPRREMEMGGKKKRNKKQKAHR